MRYLVISDIHANLEAFETVMAAAKPLNYDKVLLLGDLVGYGADPNAICERIRAMKPDAIIRGNHDKVGSGVESPEGFNAVARNAIGWTYNTLTKDNPDTENIPYKIYKTISPDNDYGLASAQGVTSPLIQMCSASGFMRRLLLGRLRPRGRRRWERGWR